MKLRPFATLLLALTLCLLMNDLECKRGGHKADDLPGWLGEKKPRSSKNTRQKQFERMKAAKGQQNSANPEQDPKVQDGDAGPRLTWTTNRETGIVTYDPPLLSRVSPPVADWHLFDSQDSIHRYLHMLSLSRGCHNTSLVAAWQAAQDEEGEDGQHIMVRFSTDSTGKSWWPPQAMRGGIPEDDEESQLGEEEDEEKEDKEEQEDDEEEVKQNLVDDGHHVPRGGKPRSPPQGALWGPVLHCDRKTSKLRLFFSASTGDCWRPAGVNTTRAANWIPPKSGTESPAKWVVGGDIKVVAFKPASGTWSDSEVLYPQDFGAIPKVIANGVAELESGDWLLPFWRQRPRPVQVYEPETNVSSLTCLSKKPTSAGVLITSDQGKTWRATGALGTALCLHPSAGKTRGKLVLSKGQLECGASGWLIENTVAQLKDGRLLMMFRTRSGFIYQSWSEDDSQTWSLPSLVATLPNPDSKIALLRLSTGVLALAFNDHQRPFVLAPSGDQGNATVEFQAESEIGSEHLEEVPGQHDQSVSAEDEAPCLQDQPTRVRHRLTVALSEDGESWHRVARVDTGSGVHSQLQIHYPSLLELPHGRLLVGYTRSMLNEFQPGEEMNPGASRANDYQMRIAEFDLMTLHSHFQHLKQEEAKRERMRRNGSGIISWILSFFWRS